MTAVLTRKAFGAEFFSANGFLNSPTYGLPPRFVVDALQNCIGQWQSGTMEVPLFDNYVHDGRAGFAALAGVPLDSVAMGGTVSAVLGLVAAAIPDGSRVVTLEANSQAPHSHSQPRRVEASRSPNCPPTSW